MIDADTSMTLADGRVLAFRDLGERDAPAVVFNPGFMACRLTGRAAPGARVITVDRPGIGASSPSDRRTVAQWPHDVEQLADQLGIDTFAVLGHSLGSPYALATARALSPRVRSLGVACGFAPFDREHALDGLNQRMAKALPALRRAPWMARLATGSLPRQYRRDPAAAFHKQFGRDLPDCDQRALTDPLEREQLLTAAVEATRQGARPLALEMQLGFARPWGVEPSDIDVPTHLWYGEDDTLTPPQMGRFLEEQISGAELTIFPGEGHMAAFIHWFDIIGTLVA